MLAIPVPRVTRPCAGALLLLAATLAPRHGLAQNTSAPACGPRPHVVLPAPPPGADLRRPVDGAKPVCPDGQVPIPQARYAPKGKPLVNAGRTLPPDGTTTAPSPGPAPPSPQTTTHYFYAGAYASVAVYGATASLTEASPTLAATDAHTLAEISAQTADQLQTVEVGWNVDNAVNSDTLPHLFVFHWVNGVGTCYNACGWVQVSSTHYPGMGIAGAAATAQYASEYIVGTGGNPDAWWIWYQNEWMGYFPASLWTSPAYTEAGLVQWFGEVATSETVPTSQMGNGLFGTSAGSAAFTSMGTYGSSNNVSLASAAPNTVTAPADYDLGETDGSDFSFGGPGGGCMPESCSSAGVACGSAPNGCGGMLSCDPCGTGLTCVSNQCTCVAQTCGAAECGSVSNGCGGMVPCGGCGTGLTCVANHCTTPADAGSVSSSDAGPPDDAGPGTPGDAGPVTSHDAGPTPSHDAGPATTDAGQMMSPDAGQIASPDAGEVTSADAGFGDAGQEASPDAGETSSPDAGSEADAGQTGGTTGAFTLPAGHESKSSGCACSAGAAGGGSGEVILLLVPGLLALGRCRRVRAS